MDKSAQRAAFEPVDLCDLLEQAKVDLLTGPYPAIALAVKRIDAAIDLASHAQWTPVSERLPKPHTAILVGYPENRVENRFRQ